jgi:hypothetical protein
MSRGRGGTAMVATRAIDTIASTVSRLEAVPDCRTWEVDFRLPASDQATRSAR